MASLAKIHIDDYDYNNFWDNIRKFQEEQHKKQEQDLAKIIEEYDFVVGSSELKDKLERILPDGANIVYSNYIDTPTKIFAIKKFDVFDLIKIKEG